MSKWKAYLGDGRVHADRLARIPDPPPWRDFASQSRSRGATFQVPPEVVEVVNAALYLRRPVLVTGDPGVGKSSLAYSIAYELGLGSVLVWSINSRSTLLEGLYQYDALARLREVSLQRAGDEHDGDDNARRKKQAAARENIGRYITLAALGTAFVAQQKPRVVLIDEIDKSDIDLPNDLLHVFENGFFEIPELVRIADEQPFVEVGTNDPDDEDAQVRIERGRIHCKLFPVVVITSNGERDLPPAFLRRCLRADIKTPEPDQLQRIVQAHLGTRDRARLKDLLGKFTERRDNGAMLATDQLLNAFFLITRGKGITDEERTTLERVLLRDLNR
jgi:MoxR-like ATPase